MVLQTHHRRVKKPLLGFFVYKVEHIFNRKRRQKILREKEMKRNTENHLNTLNHRTGIYHTTHQDNVFPTLFYTDERKKSKGKIHA